MRSIRFVVCSFLVMMSLGVLSAQEAGSIRVDSIPGTGLAFSMSFIPEGEFLMGSPESEPDREEDEGPQQYTGMSAFWMGQMEVRFEEYEVFRQRHLDTSHPISVDQSYDADAVTRPSPPYEDPSFGMGTTGYPASSMTQYAALQYCKWLYQKTGIFYRLPTEAEWEYACRAGTESPWFFGSDPDSLDHYGWYYGNSNGVFHPVGEKRPNPWGLYDMYGNVAEWTLDQYQEDFLLVYQEAMATNPWRIPQKVHPRTVRGGTYDDDPAFMRSAERLRSSLKWKERDPQFPKSYWWNTDSPFVGFRIVSPVNQPSAELVEEFFDLVLPD